MTTTARMVAAAAVLMGPIVLAGCDARVDPPAMEAMRLLNGGNAQGFARALEPGAIRFPADHGPHPAYRTEWWYFTGNLQANAGRHFGFELTFFRFALAGDAPERTSAWGGEQIYMAHFAVTDTSGRRHIAAEQLDRAALGVAGARARPFRVWVGDWSAASEGGGLFPLRLRAGDASAGIDLQLTALRPVVLHGEEGLSRKGRAPGNASYYYSFTRLAATGRVRVDGRSFDVTGTSWLDREWSTSTLEAEGWDWFALQLEDGRDLMFYRLRCPNGSSSPFSAGSLVMPDGARRALAADDVLIDTLGAWTSPATGVTYPMGWRLELPRLDLALKIEPRLEDQEMDLSVRYWEGAVRVSGRSAGGKSVNGVGYVELAGYGEGAAPRLAR